MTSISLAPSFSGPAAARLKPQLLLVGLLFVEILYLTFTLDTQPLARVPSVWATLIGWAPQYLRLAISIFVLMLLFGRLPFLSAISTLHPTASPTARLPYLAVHGIALLAFFLVSRTLFAAGQGVAAHPAAWAAAWSLSGLLTIGFWALAVFPPRHWTAVAREQRIVIASGTAAGTLVWASGFITEAFWKPLAGFTFAIVSSMLRAFYTDVVSIPDKMVVGTSSFHVSIAPACSGYEGVGLILAFLGIYLYLLRNDLRFPAAFILLPIGAVTIWILNAVRIFALIVMGTSGSREVALGGFHSQAGWIVFNVVGLGFVVLINRGGYFARETAARPAVATTRGPDPTSVFLGPFVSLLATAMVTGAFSAGFDRLYPLRLAVVGAVIAVSWRTYASLRWSVSFGAFGIGVATFVVWMAMLPAGISGKESWPTALQAMPAWSAAVWLATRVIGYVLLAPFAEELAFRGYATRRFISSDIDNVSIGAFSWMSFVLSSLVFGAFHGQLWIPGTVAGMAFAFALYRRRSFGDAVLAHATTNGLIACYVFVTGNWSVWS